MARKKPRQKETTIFPVLNKALLLNESPVYDLLLAGTEGHEQIDGEDLLNFLLQELGTSAVLYVARQGIQLVGFAVVQTPQLLNRYPSLIFLYNSKPEEGKIRDLLLGAAIDWAAENGWNKLATAYYGEASNKAFERLAGRVVTTYSIGTVFLFDSED